MPIRLMPTNHKFSNILAIPSEVSAFYDLLKKVSCLGTASKKQQLLLLLANLHCTHSRVALFVAVTMNTIGVIAFELVRLVCLPIHLEFLHSFYNAIEH